MLFRSVDDILLEKIAKVLGVTIEDIKSTTPVIMNFHNSPYNVPYGTQNNYINEKAMEQLFLQLSIKDNQIQQLINKMK